MKKLVLKELREQLAVTLIGFIVLTFLLVQSFTNCRAAAQRAAITGGYAEAGDLQPLLSQSVLTEVGVCCALLGALLGWLQIRAEKHPDLWAFLVHRPIDRRTILWSKIVGGLLLYGMAAGIPLLGLVIVTSLPGRVAVPFDWAMALPLLSLFLIGTTFLGAGMLTGLRKTRWYASRGFGLGPALFAVLAIFPFNEFWQHGLVIVATAAVTWLATWGSFQTGGSYREQSAVSKGALAMASGISMMLVLGLFLSLLIDLVWSPFGVKYSAYHLTKSGQVVKANHSPGDDEESVEITDLQGAPFLNPKTGAMFSMRELQPQLAPVLSAQIDPKFPTRQGYGSTTRFFHPWSCHDKTLWYLLPDGRLVGYHGITRRQVGFITPTGEAADGRFLLPSQYYISHFRRFERPEPLASARAVHLVNVATRQTLPIFQAAEGDPILTCSQSVIGSTTAESNMVVVVSRQKFRVISLEGRTLMEMASTLPPDMYPAVQVSLLDGPDLFAVRQDPSQQENQKVGDKFLTQVSWIQADGTVRERRDLPKIPPPQFNRFAEQCLTILLPTAFPYYETPLLVTVLRLSLAVACVAIGWRLALLGNLPLRSRIAWALFHLLTGLPGLLAFLGLQERPARERCPKCGRLRVVTREQCEHCASSFAPPQKVGIEIFEPLSS